ncbi:GNAT family N-acetyltransferase [Tsukamurella strandjordii]|uniref:GNAT family N-acetyltransferase n=1 Tax=Tsukamurella strandjordii TaxID=147577 RepID=A0AA90NEY1_9ACTN|nr:GNAT family N-acetyltransferase [Tsukamurella strandjordii]MDP0397903.1 GNAT family N-acetyltransferase [Tsukamurella strandjordii]
MITFRRVTRDDFGLLAVWLSEPHNRRWWNHETSPEAIERDFGPSVDGAEPSTDFLAIDDAGAPVGLIQRQRWVDYPDEDETAAVGRLVDLGPRDYGIDYLVGLHYATGRGLGTAMIRTMCAEIFEQLDGARVVVAVAAGNRRSWRALERAGFTLVGHTDIPAENPIDPPDHVVYLRERVD